MHHRFLRLVPQISFVPFFQVPIGTYFTLLILALACCPPALGNDTTASVGIGGITLEKNRDVVMVSEDLFVSLDQIIVKYIFRNASDQDRKVTVAFPLPDVSFNSDQTDGEFTPDQFHFFTFVDNSPVKMSVAQSAMLRGNDETSTIQRLNLSLDPNSAAEVLSGASDARKNEVAELGLVDENGNPAWTLRTTYFWTQTFPAHKDVRVEHRYKPSVGGSAATSIGTTWYNPRNSQYAAACVDNGFLRSVERAMSRQQDENAFFESYISYILTTGGNWNGPIRHFHLTVDKGEPDTLVSFCGDGVVQKNSTQFELTATNYIPRKELFVLLVRKNKAATDPSPENELDGLSCDELWIKRNTLFKSRGYCFHTSKAIAMFGNSGCQIEDETKIPFSDDERDLVSRIRGREQSMRCPR